MPIPICSGELTGFNVPIPTMATNRTDARRPPIPIDGDRVLAWIMHQDQPPAA